MREEAKKSSKKNIVIMAVFVVMIVAFSVLVYTTILKRPSMYRCFEARENNACTLEVASGEILEQEFTSGSDAFMGIALRFSMRGEGEEKAGVRVCIYDENNNRMFEKNITSYEISDEDYNFILFEEGIKLDGSKNYVLTMNPVEAAMGTELLVYASNPDVYPESECRIDGKEEKNDVELILIFDKADVSKKMAVFFHLIFLVILPVFFFLLIIRKKSTSLVFPAVLIICELVYMLVYAPNMVPDEQAHAATSYYVSSSILGKQSLGEHGRLMMRADDAAELMYVNPKHPSREEYNHYYSSLFGKAENTDISESIYSPLYDAPLFLYFFSGLGMAIGRLLGFNYMTVFFLGRLFNLAVYLALSLYALKQLPFAKILLMSILLLPMSMQQGMSLSYDALVNPMSFVVIAVSLKLAYEQNEIRRHHYVMLAVCGGLLCASKGGAYIPLAGLVIFALLKSKEGQRRKVLICLGNLLLTFILAKVFCRLTLSSYAPTKDDGWVSWANAPGFTLSSCFSNPKRLIKIIYHTLTDNADHYLSTFLGLRLGWLVIELPWTIGVMLYSALMLSTVKPAGEPEYLNFKSRIVFILISGLCFGAVCAGMLLDWTPLSSSVVLGVQGRYFIPFAFTALVIFRNSGIVLKQKIDNCILMFMIILQPVIICYVESNGIFLK